MTTIPQEIVDNIIDQLALEDGTCTDDDIASYACISHHFQHSVERLTFKKLRVLSTELVEFRATFQGRNSHRRMILKELCMTIVLPDYGYKYKDGAQAGAKFKQCCVFRSNCEAL
jgi:hypothetical protein